MWLNNFPASLTFFPDPNCHKILSSVSELQQLGVHLPLDIPAASVQAVRLIAFKILSTMHLFLESSYWIPPRSLEPQTKDHKEP